MAYKPVLIHVDEEDWPIFQEMCGNYKVSKRLREMVAREIEKFTHEEVRAQQLAGLTEG